MRLVGIATVLLCAGALDWATPHVRAQSTLNPKRLDQNPLITVRSSTTLGGNVNGPTVIRVPDWIERPLGRYYMYFANHMGDFVRLAYADAVEGPWRIYEPGVLHVRDTAFYRDQPDPDRDAGRFLHSRRLSRDTRRPGTQAADHVGARLVYQRRALAGPADGSPRLGTRARVWTVHAGRRVERRTPLHRSPGDLEDQLHSGVQARRISSTVFRVSAWCRARRIRSPPSNPGRTCSAALRTQTGSVMSRS